MIILLVISSCNLLLPKNPMYRVQNYCDYTVDFKIIPTGADTIRLDNVQNNTSGDFKDINEGKINVIATVQFNSEVHIDSLVAKKNRNYTITMHDGEVFGQHVIRLEIADAPSL
jgi:hypothetical protein